MCIFKINNILNDPLLIDFNQELLFFFLMGINIYPYQLEKIYDRINVKLL